MPRKLEDDEEAVSATTARPSRVEEVIDKEITAQLQARLIQNDPPTSMTTQHSNTPKHPFRHAKDAAYTPLTSKNVGTQDKPEPPINKKQELAYRTLPPIHDLLIAKIVYKQSMETPITIMQRELLSLSPEV